MSRARSLTPAENEHVCNAVQHLMDEYGSQAAVADLLITPDGSRISQASVSLALRRAPVGVTFARAVAQHLGLSFEELVTGQYGRADGRHLYKELPGWDDAAKEVLAEQGLPRHAVIAAGEAIVCFPVKRVDSALVYDLGMLWLKHASLEARQGAERVVAYEDQKRAEEEEAQRLAMTKSGTRARRQPAEEPESTAPARRMRVVR